MMNTLSDGIVRVSKVSSGGIRFTLVAGMPLEAPALAQLSLQLNALCDARGRVRDGVIEIQGDHCDAVVDYLRQVGWGSKRAIPH